MSRGVSEKKRDGRVMEDWSREIRGGEQGAGRCRVLKSLGDRLQTWTAEKEDFVDILI